MPKQITEAAAGTVAPSTPGKIKVGLITPGAGSSGYYSQQVLENAARDRVWPKGTHVFFDHPSESEMNDRPERSVRDLAATLSEDAYWDGTQLVAEANVIGPYRELVTDPVFVESVGMSIRATAESRAGEVDGKHTTIITQLVEGLSVDLVTRAGRGGRVLAVLESARADARRAVTEATANDTRDVLHTAVKAAHGADETWVWVRDFDEATVWFDVEGDTEMATYAQTYILDGDGGVELQGDRTQVRARTEYVPVSTSTDAAERLRSLAGAAHAAAVTAAESGPTHVPAPAGRPTPTPTSEEDTMGTIQVDEAEHGRLTEAAGRVTALESERDQANERAATAEAALRDRDLRDSAARIIDTAEAGFTALERRGLLAELPVTQEGALDEAAFTTTVTEAAATRAEANGAGSIRGFGSTGNGTNTVTEADVDNAVGSAFGRTPKEA
jgi:hypothetical protein